jgi:hypothetical protein
MISLPYTKIQINEGRLSFDFEFFDKEDYQCFVRRWKSALDTIVGIKWIVSQNIKLRRKARQYRQDLQNRLPGLKEDLRILHTMRAAGKERARQLFPYTSSLVQDKNNNFGDKMGSLLSIFYVERSEREQYTQQIAMH